MKIQSKAWAVVIDRAHPNLSRFAVRDPGNGKLVTALYKTKKQAADLWKGNDYEVVRVRITEV